MAGIPEHQLGLVGRCAREAADSLNLFWHDFTHTDGDLPDWQVAASTLAALDGLLAAARTVRGELEAMAAPSMPKTATVAEGVGLVETHGSGKKTVWDVDGLRTVVAARLGARLSDDPTIVVDGDGCVLPAAEIVLRTTGRTVEAMIDLCGQSPSAAWRTAALKGLGIDPGEYRASEWSGYRVRITPDIVDTTEGATQ